MYEWSGSVRIAQLDAMACRVSTKQGKRWDFDRSLINILLLQAMQSQKRSQVRQELTQSLRHVMPLTLHVLERKANMPAGGDVAVQVRIKCPFKSQRRTQEFFQGVEKI